MLNLRKYSIKDAYEGIVKHIFNRKPKENTTTFYDLNIPLETTKSENKDISEFLPIKSEDYIKSYEKQIDFTQNKENSTIPCLNEICFKIQNL